MQAVHGYWHGVLMTVVCCSPKFYEFMKCKLHLHTEADPWVAYTQAQWEQGWFSDSHTLAVHHISVGAEAYQEKMRKIERQLAR